MTDALELFHPPVRHWFQASFRDPTRAQALAWPAIARGDSTLLLAPTGSGKTLSAFLFCLDQLMFKPAPEKRERCRVLYVSPLKALAVDVERNLRAPLVGIANSASMSGSTFYSPQVAVRTGDTPQKERARFGRDPADILITTPESLYLLLTSNAREALANVETVIIDEIHALVPTKRGAHLALSMERLEKLTGKPLQRIGLSATQRPLDEVARFLGGSRPVAIVDAGSKRALEVRVEVPVEDMSKLGQPVEIPSGPASQGPVRASIWTAIHPRLVELIREHRSTLIFVNSRRLAERLSAALNELAGEVLVQAHHGSVARAQRIEIEDNLKAGRVRGLVATSSLELGVDMSAVDLVIQIESPPSVASGLQRIGRAGHHVGGVSAGVIFPKYRADLIACAAVTRAMQDGQVESTRYPRNPLDVLAQQLVAMVAMDEWTVDALYEVVRRAAPFAELPRNTYEGVLDLLSGRYVSEDFSDLRPRLTWDRISGVLKPRESARRIAVVNGGTIPDRGLYGVYLAGAEKGRNRVGELDEEMVFESRVGETFLLGSTSWRIEEITHDRVLVSPAPGQPGKMPFWHGEQAGRPLETGQAIGALIRNLRGLPKSVALDRLVQRHGLDEKAAENVLRYLDDQAAATEVVPDDRTIVIERTRDELGDWRICVLSPFGGRLHAPWCMAVVARVKDQTGLDVETLWTDDGFVVRFPEADEAPDPSLVLPSPEEVESLVFRQLGSTALFASRFRENASRALLLPKRRPGGRAPLWQLRKRSADLLAVAARHSAFPILLETYRECLQDVFDMPALVRTLDSVSKRDVRVVTKDSQVPSPFASAILFGFVANFIYDGDAPLAERRAQALSIDQAQLRELLGDAELRELLDEEILAEVEDELQHRAERLRAKSADAIHDLLLRLGDLSREELGARTISGEVASSVDRLVSERRVLAVPIGGEDRFIAIEDAGRYRDALGTPLPRGVPEAFLGRVASPLRELVSRYARTHGPFTTGEIAVRFGVSPAAMEALLGPMLAEGRLLEGAFRPHGVTREWCDSEVLKTLRRRSLARLRREIEPVPHEVLGRLYTSWHGVIRRRRGLDALLDAIEKLQGAALPASLLEREILPARVENYVPADLDALAANGEVVWAGIEPLGHRDGRVALYLTDALPRLWRPPSTAPTELSEKELAVLNILRTRGASFFQAIHTAVGGGFPQDAVEVLWNLVWKGFITNDTFHVLRLFTRAPSSKGRRRAPSGAGEFRSRRTIPPAAEGRWSLVESRVGYEVSGTEWSTAVANQLLARYGVVTRELGEVEHIPGGFAAVYPVLKAMEETGRVRRGFFVSDVAASQFALPAALDHLRTLRTPNEDPEVALLAATDPANPWGAALPWPKLEDGGSGRGPTRTVGTHVVLVDGALGAFLSKGARQLYVFLPEHEPERSRTARAIAERLTEHAVKGNRLIEEINGAPAGRHPLAAHLLEVGFVPTSEGLQYRPGAVPHLPSRETHA